MSHRARYLPFISIRSCMLRTRLTSGDSSTLSTTSASHPSSLKPQVFQSKFPVEYMRPSHRKTPVCQNLRYLTSSPGGPGEGIVSLNARDRTLPSEGWFVIGPRAPVWNTKSVTISRMSVESQRARSKSSTCKSSPCGHSMHCVLDHARRAGRRAVRM